MERAIIEKIEARRLSPPDYGRFILRGPFDPGVSRSDETLNWGLIINRMVKPVNGSKETRATEDDGYSVTVDPVTSFDVDGQPRSVHAFRSHPYDMGDFILFGLTYTDKDELRGIDAPPLYVAYARPSGVMFADSPLLVTPEEGEESWVPAVREVMQELSRE